MQSDKMRAFTKALILVLKYDGIIPSERAYGEERVKEIEEEVDELAERVEDLAKEIYSYMED